MSDDDNVVSMRPRSTAPPGLPPVPPPPAGRPTPSPSTTATPPGPTPGTGVVSVPGSNRRSVAASLAAATAPGIPAPPPAPVPATFRSGGLDDEGEEIGMGTLGLAAILAVALAALRGTAGAITDWRQRRMERAAEAEPLRAARRKLQEARLHSAATGAGTGRKKVPSSSEFGRSAAGRGGSGSSGGRSGGAASSGRPGGSSRTGSPSGTGPGRKGSGSSSTGPGSAGNSAGGKGKGSRSGDGKAGGPGKGSSSTGKGKGSSSGSGGSSSGKGSSGGGGARKPGLLGQLALDRSTRRTARQAAAQKAAARRQKADLAERKRAAKDNRSTDSDSEDLGASAGTSRVTLGRALRDQARHRAEERLRRRRENLARPFISRTPRDDAEAAEETAAASTEDDTATGTDGPQTTTEDTTEPGTESTETADGDTDDEDTDWKYRQSTGGRRRDPWESLFDAQFDARVVWTVEQVDPPGTHARRWEPAAALDSAPAATAPAATATASTATTTKETSVSASVPIPSPRADGADPEHLTDITLDDVLTSLTTSKTDCLATHDECAVLADKARELRDQLRVLADELAQRHNVIGRMTSAAMDRLGESMDVLARQAEAMRTQSLHAAEAVEAAHDDMHDAYKPVQQATADAGLTMPSARIHNED